MQKVKDTDAMIAGMAPVLDTAQYHFCVVPDETLAGQALAMFREDEGLTLILRDDVAKTHGLSTDMPMARIILMVHSALDGVGLTAAVASGLAEAGIPCNMVAAYHHDHAFVPVADATRALAVLKALSGDQ